MRGREGAAAEENEREASGEREWGAAVRGKNNREWQWLVKGSEGVIGRIEGEERVRDWVGVYTHVIVFLLEFQEKSRMRVESLGFLKYFIYIKISI